MGENVAVTPLGRFVAARVTLPVKPFRGKTSMSMAAELETPMVMLLMVE